MGTVVKLGPGAEKGVVQVGDRVGIKWIASVCGSCREYSSLYPPLITYSYIPILVPCLEDADGLCFKQKISGYYHPGTFQQYVLGPANYVTPIPDGLSSAEVAPFLCAGVTTYSALRKTKAKSGQWVVISGAGGGLGHLAVQMASRGFAYRVIGIDDASKETLVKESGAEHFVDLTKHTDESIAAEVKRLAGGLGASAVVVCTGNNRAYAQALDFLRFRGTLVCVGMPEGEPVPIAKSFPARLVGRETRIVASAVGNRKEAIETLEMAARGIVKTHYRVEKMDKLTEVFQEMEEGKLVGRIVIDLQ